MENRYWKITEDKNWDTLRNRFSWVADMERVEQHSQHHAEGNVAIHTRMVLEELKRTEDFSALDIQEQEILWTAALLHDVEKRSSSCNEGNGIISAHGHARKGEYTARTILYKEIPVPFQIREQIASLVRFHGLPLWVMERADPRKKVIEASLRVNTYWLKLLAEADARGRICEDLGQLLENIELFELLYRESGCWKEPRHFASPHARFRYFHTENSYVEYIPFDDFKCEVILLAGLPGMGKDYYMESLKSDYPVVSPDALRRKYKINPTDKSGNGWIIQQAKEEARVWLRKGENFIWNATNITSLMRSQLVDLFTDYGAKVKIVYLEKPYDVWRKQNMNRPYPVPENVLDKMFGKLEIPQLTEAHEVEYIIG
ncbi:MAG: AAA family ATPase [Tannerellaceae bacterium]|nr:AAA family ATPase [Tannerellaceae bacterium]